MRKIALFFLFLAAGLFAQQPQTQTAPVFAANAKYVQGVGPGYWPTAGTGLTLNLTAGTAFCGGAVQTYAGGSLTMTASATNYVYLNTTASCAPAVKTTAFTSSDIPVATVVAGASTITTITDDRTFFQQGGSGGSGAFAGGAGVSFQDAAEIAAPANPASGYDRLYLSSASHLLACLTSGGANCMPASGGGGTVFCTPNAQTGTAYTLALTDGTASTVACIGTVTMNNAATNTVTVPPNSSVALPTPDEIDFIQLGAGQTCIAAGAGVTLNTPTSLCARAQNSTFGIRQIAANTWQVFGDTQ